MVATVRLVSRHGGAAAIELKRFEPERFPAKRTPARVKKTHQDKKAGARF
jgi:hypothetical protein